MLLGRVIQSVVGELLLLADEEYLRGVYFEGQDSADWQSGESEILVQAETELQAYFAGELQNFTVPFTGIGTEFQRQVWEQLTLIPYGETCSYGDIAKSLGKPGAMRAVGLANGRNPISIIVPCHRVIGANKKLVGFGGGLARKQALLELEARGSGKMLL